MKKLSLLIVAILILGCDTETPVVEGPLSISDTPSPVAASGQHLRVDIIEPRVAQGDIADGNNDIDPEPLNQVGIGFWFNRNLKLYKVDLRHHEGESLGWLPRGVVDDKDIGQRIQIIPAADSQMLEFDTAYVIGLYVQDFNCRSLEVRIRFWTKPKP